MWLRRRDIKSHLGILKRHAPLATETNEMKNRSGDPSDGPIEPAVRAGVGKGCKVEVAKPPIVALTPQRDAVRGPCNTFTQGIHDV